MLDLLLLNPGAGNAIYGALTSEFTAVEPPLWCRLIAGYARDHQLEVKIIDADALGYSPDEVGELVAAAKPRLCCIVAHGHQPSASTQQMVGAEDTIRAIRLFSDVPILLVGGHVSVLPERTMRDNPGLTFACVGEGPVTVVGLLSALTSESDVPGLVWRSGGEIVINLRAPDIRNLAIELHGNAWDLLPMERYRSHNWQCLDDLKRRQPYASIYTSLGCPFKCSFCMINAPFESNRYRMREPAAVTYELEQLHRHYGVSTFKIVDEMFVLNERHYGEICKRLIRSGISKDLNMWAYARVDTVRPDRLALLRDAGIQWLALGIESGSKHVRDGAQKALRQEDIIGTVRSIQAAGINVIGNFIFGLRDDTIETMRETLELALECQPEWANFYSAMAYPGSQLYTDAVKNGWRLPRAWSGYSQHSYDTTPLDTEFVSGEAVLEFRDTAFQRYFSEPSYLRMLGRKFGPDAVTHIQRMVGHGIKRELLEGAVA